MIDPNLSPALRIAAAFVWPLLIATVATQRKQPALVWRGLFIAVY
jgi:hypothetical protein